MACSRKLKPALYDVSSAVNFIMDPTNPPYLRAIRLYETQVAITFGSKLNDRQRQRKQFPDRWLAVPSDILAAATVCSAIRLLEYLQKIRNLNESSGSDLLKDLDAQDVLGRILITPDGLKKIAVALKPRSFDLKLHNRRIRKSRFAPLYDVSVRYEVDKDSRLVGGWTTGVRLFKPKQGTEEHATVRRYYRGLRSRSTAYELKDEDDFLAGFVWLRHYGGGKFRPRKVRQASFANRLLAEACDAHGLAQVFGQYEFLKAHLEQRGYELLALDLTHPVAHIQPTIRPLSEELLDAIF